MAVDPVGQLQQQINDLKAQLSISQSDNDRLRNENATLAATAAKAVTQEANVIEVKRAHEYASQRCYRCDHPAGAPAKDCLCCQKDHTPDADGNF